MYETGKDRIGCVERKYHCNGKYFIKMLFKCIYILNLYLYYLYILNLYILKIYIY